MKGVINLKVKKSKQNTDEDSTFKSFKKMVRYFPQKWLLVVGVLIIGLLTAISIFYSYLIKNMIDSAVNKDLNALVDLSYVLVGVLILEMGFSYLRTKVLGKYAEQGVARFRQLMAKKLAHYPVSEIEGKHSGDFVSRVTNDISKVRSFASTTIFELLFHPLAAVGAYGFILYLNWKLTLLITAIIPIIFFGSNILSKPMGKYSKKMQEHLGVVNSVAQDAISGIAVAKAFNLNKKLQEKYNISVDDSVNSEKDLARRRSFIQSFSQLMGIIPFLVTFIFGGYWAIQGMMTIGSLLAFINLLNRLTHPISMLPQLWGKTKSSMAAVDRIYEIIESESERENGQEYEVWENNKTAELVEQREVLKFSNVKFSYPEQNENIIDDLTFTVEKGESVALVGPSGGGKSTIMKLILGYYEDYQGQIDLFAHCLNQWNLKSLREEIALVSQDTYLFPESVEENISYGRIGASKDEIIRAAKAANAHQFISELKNGYRTKVGELGNKLSGGQKQRISIARAILKNASLLLLDEATSALDTESEALVQEALDRFMEERTSLIIAHRLSTIRNVDRILVINEGRIVESGKHKALLEKGGLYSKLYYRQLRDQEIEGEVV